MEMEKKPRFLGFTLVVPLLLAELRLTIQPSYSDGFSLGVLGIHRRFMASVEMFGRRFQSVLDLNVRSRWIGGNGIRGMRLVWNS